MHTIVWTIVLICITVVSAVILWHLKQAQKSFDDENLAMVDTRESGFVFLFLSRFKHWFVDPQRTPITQLLNGTCVSQIISHSISDSFQVG